MSTDKDLIPEKPIDHLYDKAVEIIETARNNTYRQINENLVRRNWDLGKLISEEEIRGRDRTELYGLEVIKSLAKRLTLRYGKGFTKTNLYSFTNFYKMFPDIFHTPCGKSFHLLSWSHYRTLLQVLDHVFRSSPSHA